MGYKSDTTTKLRLLPRMDCGNESDGQEEKTYLDSSGVSGAPDSSVVVTRTLGMFSVVSSMLFSRCGLFKSSGAN